MRIRIKQIAALATGAILVSGVLCQTASAQILLGSLPSVFPSYNPADTLGVRSVVTFGGSSYTYTYTISNPLTDADTFDFYSVTINTALPGAYLAGGTEGPGEVSWTFAPVAPGGSETVSFTSDLGPGLGNANASDSIPPSPWVGVGQVLVPVPEPTTLISGAALLLPFGMSTLRGLRKKLTV
jgi:hypothetical protein